MQFHHHLGWRTQCSVYLKAFSPFSLPTKAVSANIDARGIWCLFPKHAKTSDLILKRQALSTNARTARDGWKRRKVYFAPSGDKNQAFLLVFTLRARQKP